MKLQISFFALLAAVSVAEAEPQGGGQPDVRAAAAVASMTLQERLGLLHGPMALPLFPAPLPAEAVFGAGFIPGVKRLGIPNLTETDASLGVAWVGGLRHDAATALPSGMALGSTWNPDILRQGGAVIGSEAKAKGFNVMLAGGANLIREPRGGRTFEYLSEDPLLTGVLVGASIQGIQSNHIVSTIKHFALNGQETGRKFVSSNISDAAARESDLLAFEIGIERGAPGAVMCAYNLVNDIHACRSDYLLNKVLKTDWGYKGWVMSDWGALSDVQDAFHGLDQESGEQVDHAVYFGKPLADLAERDPAASRRVTEMATRIVRTIYAVGADKDPATKAPIDLAKDALAAEAAEKEAIVLLKNTGLLPLPAGLKKIVVIGGYADTGVLSGGGSSQVEGEGGPAALVPKGGDGPFAAVLSQAYQRSNPLRAITARSGGAQVVFRDGRYITDAVQAAKTADAVIVFATQWTTEGVDVPDLSLPNGQDALIEAVASANPKTIVVLETGGPVATPWIAKPAAVLEAWYPGIRGGQAIASVLFGETNPSGRLPVTFPASTDQLPRPELDGAASIEPDFQGETGGKKLVANYDIEGSDVGYRWFSRVKAKPAFPFGFGLSYTRFEESGLRVSREKGVLTAQALVKNVGDRDGADVVEVYLTARGGTEVRRLVGFQKLALKAGETRAVTIPLEPRILADWAGKGWLIRAGDYAFALGQDAETMGNAAVVNLPAQTLKP